MRQATGAAALNIALLGLWVWLYQPVGAYLSAILSAAEFRTNQLILVGTLILVALRVRREGGAPRLSSLPQLYAPALALGLGASALYVAAERLLDINILAAVLAGLASYGLLGLWMAPRPWRQGAPAALLLIGALPFGDFMDVFVGYPLRIATATVVRDGLAAAGVGAVGVDTILIFENGVSQVDLPCSGVRSLWTGGLFLLAATWVERRRFGPGWLLAAAAFAALLVVANLLRVAALVVSGPVLGWPLLAEMLHVPMGVLGFAGACAAAVWMLRRLPALPQDDGAAPARPRPPWLAPALAAALILLALSYSPRPPTAAAAAPAAWAFPAELELSPLPPQPHELEWLFNDGAEAVERVRFRWRGFGGSMLLVTSTIRRAHHNPERCFTAYGLTVEHRFTHLSGERLPVRVLSLRPPGDGPRLSASYWFQSATRTTDDYGSRFWADVSLDPQRWVLVTILFDRELDPADPDIDALYQLLSAEVARQLGPPSAP